jgi:uncharacterized phiE125 gp8 family phage protein
MGLSIYTPPSGNIIDDATAQAHCKVDSASDLALVQLYRNAAEDMVINHLRRALLPTVFEYTLDEFPWDCYGVHRGDIDLPVQPYSSMTHIKYYDTDGVEQTLSSALYIIDSSSKPVRITPTPEDYWPETQALRPNSVTIRFTAGYANAGAVPAAIKAAILLHLGTLYNNRENAIIGTIAVDLGDVILTLLSPYVNRWNT